MRVFFFATGVESSILFSANDYFFPNSSRVFVFLSRVYVNVE
jgi:hypothetical protein